MLQLAVSSVCKYMYSGNFGDGVTIPYIESETNNLRVILNV
jgi:hypothetical protein